jgi:hypothetical protein
MNHIGTGGIGIPVGLKVFHFITAFFTYFNLCTRFVIMAIGALIFVTRGGNTKGCNKKNKRNRFQGYLFKG